MQQNKARNVKNNPHMFIVRIYNDMPVIFDAASKKAGQLKCVMKNKEETVGVDFYSHCIPMDREHAEEVVKAYVERKHIPFESVRIRDRMPSDEPRKSGPRKQRKTNDANLQLVHSEPKNVQDKGPQESSQDYRSLNEINGVSDFTTAVQNLHDGVNQDSSEEDQEQAKVEHAQPRQRRAYNKTPTEERSKRSVKALEKFQRTMGINVEKVPAAKDAKVEASKDVSDAQIKEAYAELGMMVANLLRMTGNT